MADNGEEKLVAIARQIAKSLGRTETMTDDIIKIFSNFDGRLREKLTEKLSDDDVERILDSLDRQISGYISSDRFIWSNSADSSAFLDAVDRLIASIRDWTPLADDKNISSYLDRAENLLQQSMFRLEDEFRTLAERGADSFDLARGESAHHHDYSDDDDVSVEDDDNFIPLAQPVTDYDIIIDALPAGTIGDLHEIAKRMVVAGYLKECSHVYSTYRREFLEESFSRLGLQKLSIDEVQKMQWAQLEDEIEKWVKAISVALRILFPSERRLCDRIFLGLSSAADLSFMEVCRGSTIQLLNFADAVAIGSRAPERLFKVLDVYEAVRDLMPEFEFIFSDQYGITLRNEVITIWKRLGEAIRGVFMELENLIRRDPAKAAVPGGGVHPMTRYVMNYLRAACRSRRTLEQIFEESVRPHHSSNFDYRKGDNRALSSSSSLAVRMEWIMEFLESNLEGKSKIYRDKTLSSIFMMNNGRYIVQKVKDNDLGTLLGDDWIRKHEAKIKQYHVNYQRGTWSKVLAVLKIDSNTLSPVAPKSLRDKLKLFNTYFEEICSSQSTWVIVDESLGEELRASIRGSLIPAYRNFIGRLQALVDFGKHGDRNIRYSVEDIGVHIGELFQSGSGKR